MKCIETELNLQPPQGWPAFSRSLALTAALWDQLPPAEWSYLNPAADVSIWEHRRDGGWLYIEYDGDAVTKLLAAGDLATCVAGRLAAEFELAAISLVGPARPTDFTRSLRCV